MHNLCSISFDKITMFTLGGHDPHQSFLTVWKLENNLWTDAGTLAQVNNWIKEKPTN